MIIDATFAVSQAVMDADFGVLSKGEKGDAFTYDDLTDEQKNEIGSRDIINNHEKRITNLEKNIADERFDTDSDIAYIKNVPLAVCPYAQIDEVGGMTRRCENLIRYPYVSSSTTISGVTITILSDGGISVSGTSTESVNFGLWYPIKGEFATGTYTISGGTSDITILARKYNSSGSNVSWIDSMGSAKSGTLTAGEYVAGINMYISSGKTVNATVYPMFNYGTTAKPYELYFNGLRHTKVTELVSRDTEGNIIETFAIPETVQALEGYGLGVDATYYNKIVLDIDNGVKEFRANCERFVVDGTIGEYYASGGYKSCWVVYYKNLYGKKIMDGIADKYKKLSSSEFLNGTADGAYLRITEQLIIRDARFTDKATAHAILSANPVEVILGFDETDIIDISAHFSDDNFIKVQEGGTLVFENENENHAPSAITYMLKEG